MLKSKYLEKCNICPNKCLINRYKNFGFCKANDNVKISLFSLHKYEEPCISGKNGSGTIFFSNCNLKCKFCQNYEISDEGVGREISIEKLADIMLFQQRKGAHNINLVTPTIYTIQIIEAIKIAKKGGLNIPIIYNCGGYEKVETIKMLNGFVDIYLPDFKYYFDDIAIKYSGVKNYFKNASKAVIEMKKQVGNPIFDENGIIKSGLIIRHLILPNNTKNTRKVLDFIYETLGKDTYISIMSQYFPTYKAKDIEELNRKINRRELKVVKDYIQKLGFENGYIQNIGKNEECYVPNFGIDKNIL